MRPDVLAALALAAPIAMIVLFHTTVHGVWNVPVHFPVDINITTPTGQESLTLGGFTVKTPTLLEVVVRSHRNGNGNIFMHGVLLLKGRNGNVYTVDLGDLFAGHITRRLPVLPDHYTVVLDVDWKASGSGEFTIDLTVKTREFTIPPPPNPPITPNMTVTIQAQE